MTVLAFSGGAIQLVPDGTLLFHILLIVVMVVVLNRTLLGPINRVLEERDKSTKGRFREAQQALASAEERMAEYERKLREARAGGYKLLEEARTAASLETGQKIAAVRSEVGQWRDKERAGLQLAEAQAKTSLAGDAKQRATEISGRILGRTVSSRDQ
jgi:F-type H+-transporting ATPase subunit b